MNPIPVLFEDGQAGQQGVAVAVRLTFGIVGYELHRVAERVAECLRLVRQLRGLQHLLQRDHVGAAKALCDPIRVKTPVLAHAILDVVADELHDTL